ncbi:MAG: hypothetical protein L0I84_01365 [Halomonas subglaciescola]|nr:hypothetical protein [Halomonas subglaciescola]
MPNKYKVHPLRANLLAVAVVLVLWTPAAPPAAALVLWISVSWLFITALLLEFSHRRARGVLPWQLFPGILLIGLIAAAPERHVLLVWAWIALFMLPQPNWVAAFNISGMLLSMILIAPLLSAPTWVLMLLTLGVLCLVAISRARQLTLINGDILQRLRLMPGLNLWAREQLLRDLKREQLRCEREAIHGELLLFHLKRRQLWPMVPRLCQLIYGFENAYRVDTNTLAAILLSRSPAEALERRQRLIAAFPPNTTSQYVELTDIETDPLDLHALNVLSPIGDA